MHVAPYEGVWIETTSHCSAYTFGYVAPNTGAWIETNKINQEYGSDGI